MPSACRRVRKPTKREEDKCTPFLACLQYPHWETFLFCKNGCQIIKPSILKKQYTHNSRPQIDFNFTMYLCWTFLVYYLYRNIPFTCVAFTEFIIFSKKTIPIVTGNFFSRFNVSEGFHTCCIPAS